MPRTFNQPAHPGSSSAGVSERMSRQVRLGTTPELLLRRELHRRGLRYRVGLKVPGRNRRTIDVAFTRARLAVFVDGCFWHSCPEHLHVPTANRAWWEAKLGANAARDRDTDEVLAEAGWAVLRLWEHVAPGEGVDQVQAALSARRDPGPGATPTAP